MSSSVMTQEIRAHGVMVYVHVC